MSSFDLIYDLLRADLLRSRPVDVGSWHSQKTKGNPLLVTMELTWINFNTKIPTSVRQLQQDMQPNLPWAETHFSERVSGEPLNPPPSHVDWPWAHGTHQDKDEKFSHTYPERFWPKFANVGGPHWDSKRVVAVPHNGIRFEYGDLEDVVQLMIAEPYTRQAYLPVFFPEDTGGQTRLKERIPCSMGYHFLTRDDPTTGQPVMDCGYTMRSCDFVRHFRDDVYMAGRLLMWMCMSLSALQEFYTLPGQLRVNIGSLHAMEGDRYKLTEEEKNGTR